MCLVIYTRSENYFCIMHKSGLLFPLPSSYPVVEDAAAGVADVVGPAADVLVVVHL